MCAVPPVPQGLETFMVGNERPVGRLTLKPTPAMAMSLGDGFEMVMTSELVPFRGIVVGLNAMVATGGASASTVDEAVLPGPLSLAVTFPVVLLFSPGVVAVTPTVKEQDAPAVKDAPERLMEVAPATAEMVPPPQEPVRPGGVATTSPAGRLSAKPIPVSVAVPFGLPRLNVSVVGIFRAAVLEPNDLPMVGGVAAEIEKVCGTSAAAL